MNKGTILMYVDHIDNNNEKIQNPIRDQSVASIMTFETNSV